MIEQHIPYEHAYDLCQEMLLVLIGGMAGLFGFVVWSRKEDARRQERGLAMLDKIIAKIENPKHE